MTIDDIIKSDVEQFNRREKVLNEKPSRDDYHTWEEFCEAYKKWYDEFCSLRGSEVKIQSLSAPNTPVEARTPDAIWVFTH